MDIASSLRFVKGAVAGKTAVPEMTHFAIERNTIRSFNGTMALCSPIAFDVDCMPKASTFAHAINNCEADVITLSMTPNSRLRVQGGDFRAYIECIDDPVAHVLPEGDMVPIDGDVFLDAFKRLMPFVGDDASRLWTNGILLNKQSACATNNVCLVEYWLGILLPYTINVPSVAIREMLRIKESPVAMQLTESSVTFHYADQRWLRTQLYETTWPFEKMQQIFELPHSPTPTPEGLAAAIERVIPFLQSRNGDIYLRNQTINTSKEEDDGVTIAVANMPENDGCYGAEQLRIVATTANKVDWSGYPGPCIFYGDKLRGAIIGRRM